MTGVQLTARTPRQIVMTVEGLPDVANPYIVELLDAISAMTSLGGPSFVVLKRPDGDYAQAGGGDGEYAVEWREWLDRRFVTFRHYAAGRKEPRGGWVRIKTFGGQITVRENERLEARDAMVILAAFMTGGTRPGSYQWRDISELLV